jgi:hypothetical protein
MRNRGGNKIRVITKVIFAFLFIDTLCACNPHAVHKMHHKVQYSPKGYMYNTPRVKTTDEYTVRTETKVSSNDY